MWYIYPILKDFLRRNEKKINSLIFYVVFLTISITLNIISSIYTNFDFFKVDIIKLKEEDSEGIRKLETVIKKIYLLDITISVIQGISTILISNSENKLFFSAFFTFLKSKSRIISKILPAMLFMLFLELIPEYACHYIFDGSNKKYLLNSFFLNVAYFIANFTPLNLFTPLKPNKNAKIFKSNEKDLVRFIKNLTYVSTLEPSEAQLVNSALNLDEKSVNKILIPIEDTICLKNSMSLENVERIYEKTGLTKYLVLNNKGDCFGIFNVKHLIEIYKYKID